MNAIQTSLACNDTPALVDDARVSAPPELTMGQVLKAKRLALGWTLEQASKRTAIAAAVLQAIEETALNMFINELAKLDRHIQIYAKRLGVSLNSHQELIQKAKSSISPKDITPDLLNFIRTGQ